MCKKSQMKKGFVLLLICVMLLVLCACGKKEDSGLQKPTSESEAADTTETPESTATVDKKDSENSADSSNDAEPIAEEKTEAMPEPEEEIIEKKAPLGPEEIYTQVLDGYYADIVSEFPIDNYFPMTLGIYEAVIGCMGENALNDMGYAMKDINEDGTQELLIMEVSNQGQTSYHGERILALYTIVNDEAHFLAGGWARNRYFLLEDGRIYNEGSSGADDSSFETYKLIENTAILEQIDSADSKSGNYRQQCDEMEKLIETVAIKTFAEYETSEDYPESAKIFWSAVYVNPAEKTFATTGSDSFTADTSDYAKKLVFFTPSAVSEFKFNSLTPVDLNGEGVAFAEEELYSLDSLVMDKAVTITMAFAGDTPNYGISYTDAGGNVRRYAICESGFDGSIYLTDYKTAQ